MRVGWVVWLRSGSKESWRVCDWTGVVLWETGQRKSDAPGCWKFKVSISVFLSHKRSTFTSHIKIISKNDVWTLSSIVKYTSYWGAEHTNAMAAPAMKRKATGSLEEATKKLRLATGPAGMQQRAFIQSPKALQLTEK